MLAADIGGTKTAAALVEPDGRVGTTARIDTPDRPHLDAHGLWDAIAAVLDRVAASAGPGGLAGVGIGCGGPMAWPHGVVSPLNIPAWREFPLRAAVSERFPGLPVRVHNDAVCVAAGEHWRGAGRGRGNVLGMVVSTGVGGGLVLGGRLVDGASGNAGHIGHVVVDPDGPDCACGGRGCLEAIARGPAVTAWARENGWRPRAGAAGGARDVAADARRGHAGARAALRRAGAALGVAVASATYLCDLEVVAVGGGLSQAGAVLFDPLEDALRRHLGMAFTRKVRVVPASLGQDAGVLGAAALVCVGERYWNAELAGEAERHPP